MSKHSTIVETEDGEVHVRTTSRWMGLIPMPNTGVIPYQCSAGDLARLGTFIKWTTSDPSTLEKLHAQIVHLVQEVGLAGFVEIRNSARMTDRIWKTFGGAGSGLQNMADMAAQEGAPFPVPADVLKYVKGLH